MSCASSLPPSPSSLPSSPDRAPLSRLALALAQINPTVGDVSGNLAQVRRCRAQAAVAGADLLLCPELVVSGYPPEDLVLKPFFLDRLEAAVQTFAAETADGGPAVLLTTPWRHPAAAGEEGGRPGNAVLLLEDGAIRAVRFKTDLPNYGVFDEKRVFTAGDRPEPVRFRGLSLGVLICEDMWGASVAAALAAQGAELLLVPNGSPFEAGKAEIRRELAAARVKETGLPLVYLNLVGGQDELVFDGGSFVMAADGSVPLQAPAFVEALPLTVWERQAEGGWRCLPGEQVPQPEPLAAIYQAMVVGLRDYVDKNRFPGVLLGLSGGIDSAISAAVAVDALGAARVHCVMMPSPYTSVESLEDAAEVARRLGCRLDTVSITPAMAAFSAMLAPVLMPEAAAAGPVSAVAAEQALAGITAENIQSRARGLTLMALSNRTGAMVLSTGNKSEMSVGYATLYGDMCGGYSVLKDVYKTTVFALSEWRNGHRPAQGQGPAGAVIPQRVITKPPSAELKPDQTDQDTLPPYPVLDAILEGLVEKEQGLDVLVAEGHPHETVHQVWRMLDRAEYKRRQAPPGVKISRRGFGRDRRYPITNGFLNLL